MIEGYMRDVKQKHGDVQRLDIKNVSTMLQNAFFPSYTTTNLIN